MTLKLALSGIKNQLKNYVILFSGLTFATAVFYMFQTLAANPQFLKENTPLASIVFVFYLGAFLLAIITVVYLNYANNFLINLRQRVYAMYLMLGAKSFKIAELSFLETFTIGFFAVLSGLGVGILLTTGVSWLLIKQLDIKINHFFAWNGQAALVTIIFFLIIFALLALKNARKLIKTPILRLLNQEKTVARVRKSRFLRAGESGAGILLLGVGYWCLAKLNVTALGGIFVAIVTIVLGSFCLFDSLFLIIIQILQHQRRFAFQGLHSFTLGQLNFRLRDLTKLLSMVSIMFALALGAITVGIGFKHNVTVLTKIVSHYDLVLHDPTKKELKQVNRLKVTDTSVYHYQVKANKVIWLVDDFDRKPYVDVQANGTFKPVVHPHVTGQEMLKSPTKWLRVLQPYLSSKFNGYPSVLASKTEFLTKPGAIHTINLYVLKDFSAAKAQIKPLVLADNQKQKINSDSTQKYNFYQLFNGMFSGFEFMGLFLGIAFLTMLASCLMFKIISGAMSERPRYQILNQIGANRRLLKQSIAQELGVLFGLPGILGIIHVLFGLQMFKATQLLPQPYDHLLLPFSIFLVLYFLYYGATNWLYQKTVLTSY